MQKASLRDGGENSLAAVQVHIGEQCEGKLEGSGARLWRDCKVRERASSANTNPMKGKLTLLCCSFVPGPVLILYIHI